MNCDFWTENSQGVGSPAGLEVIGLPTVYSAQYYDDECDDRDCTIEIADLELDGDDRFHWTIKTKRLTRHKEPRGSAPSLAAARDAALKALLESAADYQPSPYVLALKATRILQFEKEEFVRLRLACEFPAATAADIDKAFDIVREGHEKRAAKLASVAALA